MEDEFALKLDAFIKNKTLDAKIITMNSYSGTSSKASDRLNESTSKIAKSICLVDRNGTLIVAILRGNKKIDMKKFRTLFNDGSIRLANEEEMLRLTGYPKGGIPPIGYSAKFVLDKDLIREKEVYCGGGSPYAILQIKISDIVKIDNPLITDITKDQATKD